MIDYNKNAALSSQKISGNRAVTKTRPDSRGKVKKLTAANKEFLKLVGLMK